MPFRVLMSEDLFRALSLFAVAYTPLGYGTRNFFFRNSFILNSYGNDELIPVAGSARKLSTHARMRVIPALPVKYPFIALNSCKTDNLHR